MVEAPLKKTTFEFSLAESVRLLATAWIGCVLFLSALVVGMVIASESGPLAALVCLLLLVATITLSLVCLRRQTVVIRILHNRGVAVDYWWPLLVLSTLGLIPGILMEVAVFLVWYRYAPGDGPRHIQGAESAEEMRDEAPPNASSLDSAKQLERTPKCSSVA